MTWLDRFWVLLLLPDNIWETEQESEASSIGETCPHDREKDRM